jgi:UPF0716 protein FxsA
VLVLVLLLIVAPLVELYVIVQVAHHVGIFDTIALLLIESAIGAWLLRRQGLNTLARIGQAVEEHRVPGKELVDGLLIIVAGALMLAPGFISDIVGYLLLIPPTRAPVRALVMRRFKDGKVGRFATFSSGSARFVGDFRAGRSATFDTTGRDRNDPPPPELPR